MAKLTIRVAGEVPMAVFGQIVRETSLLLADVERQIGDERFDWQIASLNTGSCLVEAIPVPIRDAPIKAAERVLSVFADGLRTIEKSAARPAYFTDPMLSRATGLAKFVGRPVSVTGLRYTASVNGHVENVDLSAHLTANARDVIGTGYDMLGSLEGRVEVLSAHGGYEFHLFDAVSGARVVCRSDEDTVDDIQSRYKLKATRMLVSGRVHYSRDDKPQSIRVESYRVLGGRPLPQVSDVVGLLEPYEVVGASEIRKHMRGEDED